MNVHFLYRQHGGNVVGGADFAHMFKNQVGAFNSQRESIHILERQAEEFLKLYGDQLTSGEKKADTKYLLTCIR